MIWKKIGLWCVIMPPPPLTTLCIRHVLLLHFVNHCVWSHKCTQPQTLGRGQGGIEIPGVLGSIFPAYVALASQNPYPFILYFWSIWGEFIDPILVTFGHYSLFLLNFVASYRPHLSHFWANNFLTFKVLKKCNPILVTLLKILEKTTPLITVSQVVKMLPYPAAYLQ